MLYSIHTFLRLYPKQCIVKSIRFNRIQAVNGATTHNPDDKQNKIIAFKSLLQVYKDRITFNSYLEHEKLELGYYKHHVKTIKRAKQELVKDYNRKTLSPLPLSLQFYVDKNRLLIEDNVAVITESDKSFQLPFGSTSLVDFDDNDDKLQQIKKPKQDVENEFDKSNIYKWMTNYEHFDDSVLKNEEVDESIDSEWNRQYGTPDPTAGVSRVQCGGCGALLHCSDPAIPGYLPSEIYKGREEEELKTIECQRCHFLKEYNIALDVAVQPEEYEKLLQSMKHVKALVVLMVDLLDYPCSIWPGVVDIIGKDRPLIIVGNKVDLLPGDSIGYLNRIKESLITEINKTKLGSAKIKDVCLISAKTGYGVEDLISVMFKTWLYKGDVFLVGCTNVGKSSLFNALLQSDYCKVHATDIVQRATVSRWPGTTLNLLKFPINRPSGWKIYERTKRLKSDSKLMKTEKEIRNSQLKGKVPVEAPALIGHIGRSFTEFHSIDDSTILNKPDMLVLNEKHPLFKKSKWFYDTPGVIHPDQVLSLLSTEELLLTIPKKLIRPQTYYLPCGNTIFIGGLARIDHIHCEVPCRFTIFCSETLPITVTKTEHADEVYEKFVGTELFAVPSGGATRLKSWPGLENSASLLEFSGEGPKFCCGDIVLSSIAWVAVTAKKDTVCKVAAWTPAGRGIYKRYPSVLPYSINLKGKRIRDTPAYMIGKVFSEEE